MFRFEELKIWKAAVQYAKHCYALTSSFPRHEMYSLADQLRRASLSISNNIAEGSAGSVANFQKYLFTALGSALETVNIINFAFEVGYVTVKQKSELYMEAEDLIKMIRGFLRSLRSSSNS